MRSGLVVGAAMVLGCSTRPEPPWQVELLEDEKAQLVQLETWSAKVVPRASLPRGAREGDILVEGQVDEARTAQARQSVKEVREQAFGTPRPRVGRSGSSALTPERKR